MCTMGYKQEGECVPWGINRMGYKQEAECIPWGIDRKVNVTIEIVLRPESTHRCAYSHRSGAFGQLCKAVVASI